MVWRPLEGSTGGVLSSWAAVSWLDWATESAGLGGLGTGPTNGKMKSPVSETTKAGAGAGQGNIKFSFG